MRKGIRCSRSGKVYFHCYQSVTHAIQLHYISFDMDHHIFSHIFLKYIQTKLKQLRQLTFKTCLDFRAKSVNHGRNKIHNCSLNRHEFYC